MEERNKGSQIWKHKPTDDSTLSLSQMIVKTITKFIVERRKLQVFDVISDFSQMNSNS